MSGFSFKQFQTFIDLEGEVTDEQINEIFGIFRNNSKLQKLRSEREKLKGRSVEKSAEIDAALKKFGTNKQGVISNDDLENALDPADRKRLSHDDKTRAKEIEEIRKKLGLKENLKVKEPGWYVVDHMDKPVKGPMQEGAAKREAAEMSKAHKGGDIAAFEATYFSDYEIKRAKFKEEKIRCKSYGDAERSVIDDHKGAEIGHDREGWYVETKEKKDPKKQVQDTTEELLIQLIADTGSTDVDDLFMSASDEERAELQQHSYAEIGAIVESLTEAVEVTGEDRYEFSNGKRPSGKGTWMFAPRKSIDFAKHKVGVDYFESPPDTTYSSAKQLAKAWAKEKGFDVLHVQT